MIFRTPEDDKPQTETRDSWCALTFAGGTAEDARHCKAGGAAVIDTLGKDDRAMAMYVALVVRNALEDFASAHLPDNKMR